MSKIENRKPKTADAQPAHFSVFRPSSFHIRRAAGFTFVEVLAALMFLAILIPAVVEGLSVANRTSVVAERSAIAVQLAENKLNEMCIGNAWSSAEARGDFGADWSDYHWEMTHANWAQDANMTELTISVTFSVQGKDHSVQLGTLVSNSQT